MENDSIKIKLNIGDRLYPLTVERSQEFYFREAAKLIEKTGIPKGVVNVITGFGDPCGKTLTTHNLVEKIAFTGGPETARHIIRNSADNLSEVISLAISLVA